MSGEDITLRARPMDVPITASPFCSVSRLDSQEASVMFVTLDTTSLAQVVSFVTVLVRPMTATRT